ncbi:MAG: amidohydrolase family protein [Oscillospiraceae bacterium]
MLFQNVTVVDGTGAPAYKASVGAKDGRIVLTDAGAEARQVIDGTGLHLCPGFIDTHSHGDLVFGTDFGRLCKISQGITTEIGGQCGSSMFPIRRGHEEEVKGVLSVGTIDFPEQFMELTSFEKYIDYVNHLPLSGNAKMLLGHGSLRVSVMGYQNRPCTKEELDIMKASVREAMEHGAFGISSGLIYSPSCYADTEELIELSKVVAEYGGVYATHMRNESYDVVKSVKEALRIGREAGVPVFISHHKVQGRPNWGLSEETLRLVAEARAQGQQVTMDQYPYLASMTNINAVVPPKYFAESVSGLARYAADPVMREKMKADILDPNTPFENQYINCGGWENIQISSLLKTPQYDGMTIAEAAEARGQDGFDAYFDLLAENEGNGTAIYFSMCEEDLCRIFMSPDTVVGTDGLFRTWGEKVHPRAWGTFPHAICYFHKEKKLLSLEEMIRKITLLPAERTMLRNKGAIREGWDADMVLFDYDKLQDKADYKHSNEYSEGIEYVVVNGKIAYHDKKLTEEHPGRLILHKA